MNVKKMITISVCVLWCVVVFSTSSVFAYTPTAADINVWYELSERLVEHIKSNKRSTASYEKVKTWLANAKQKASSNEQYSAILEIASNAVHDLYMKSQNTSYFTLSKKFRTQYDDEMQTPYDQPNNLSQCFKHYPLVDEYARKTNKPTSLILAMRYVESSCAMNNPANRDGLFQIINNDYEPGPVTRAWLQSQLEDFMKFMDNKRTWYFKKNPDSPRELSYTSFTYNALQTFAAMYNGIDLKTGISVYPLLNGNPYYFFGNYTEEFKGKRDGLLVFFIKMLKMEEQYFGK